MTVIVWMDGIIMIAKVIWAIKKSNLMRIKIWSSPDIFCLSVQFNIRSTQENSFLSRNVSGFLTPRSMKSAWIQYMSCNDMKGLRPSYPQFYVGVSIL